MAIHKQTLCNELRKLCIHRKARRSWIRKTDWHYCSKGKYSWLFSAQRDTIGNKNKKQANKLKLHLLAINSLFLFETEQTYLLQYKLSCYTKMLVEFRQIFKSDLHHVLQIYCQLSLLMSIYQASWGFNHTRNRISSCSASITKMI